MIQELLGDFINTSEWPCIIAECDADYVPVDGDMIGLRTIHVFGLANMLRRPIILLDSIAGMNTSAEYSGKYQICEWKDNNYDTFKYKIPVHYKGCCTENILIKNY